MSRPETFGMTLVCENFQVDDVIIVTSSVRKVVYLCTIFSTSNLSQLTSDKQHKNEKKMNKLNK